MRGKGSEELLNVLKLIKFALEIETWKISGAPK